MSLHSLLKLARQQQEETQEELDLVTKMLAQDFESMTYGMHSLNSGIDQMIMDLKRRQGINMSTVIQRKADEASDEEELVCHKL